MKFIYIRSTGPVLAIGSCALIFTGTHKNTDPGERFIEFFF